MNWSHPYDGQFYLVVAAGLAGLLVLAFRFASASHARSKALLAPASRGRGCSRLDPAQPDASQGDTLHGPGAGGGLPARRIQEHESGDTGQQVPDGRPAHPERAEAIVPAGQRPAIQKFGFGRELVAISEPRRVRDSAADETRLAWALEQLPSRFGETLPFGVFVFSDGRSTEPEEFDPMARAYRALGVPVHVVPVGDERISGDVAVQDIDAPRDARPGTRVPIRVTLRSRGYDGERTELRIRSTASGRGDVLATLPITLSGGEQAHELVIDTDRAQEPVDGGCFAAAP